MKNQYFLKDKKAQIYKTENGGVNDRGYNLPDNYYPAGAAPLWCYAKQLTQNQLYAAMAASQEETRLFVFNYYPGVKVYDLIRYQDKWYEITRADTTDDYKGELFIYVKEYRGVDPSPEQIKPYDTSKWE